MTGSGYRVSEAWTIIDGIKPLQEDMNHKGDGNEKGGEKRGVLAITSKGVGGIDGPELRPA